MFFSQGFNGRFLISIFFPINFRKNIKLDDYAFYFYVLKKTTENGMYTQGENILGYSLYKIILCHA